MKKKITAVFLALASICLLASCSGKLLSVTDNNGKELMIKTDKNGFAKTDGINNLVVYETDDKGKIKQTDDGEDVTSVIDFPNYISNGETAECESFAIKIPEGWQLQTGHTIKLFKEESQAELAFTLKSTDSVDDCLNDIKDLFKDWNADWKESEVDLGFAKAKVISSDKLIENYKKSYYVFSVKDTTYAVSASFNTKLADSVDFASVIKTMNIK